MTDPKIVADLADDLLTEWPDLGPEFALELAEFFTRRSNPK